MKTITLSTLAYLTMTGIAMAGSPVTPAPVQVSAPPVAANDWGGFYAGGMAAYDTGVARAVISGVPGPDFPLADGGVYGAFAGYNIQNGAFVYGGELAYTISNMSTAALPNSLQQFYGDAKLRAGYSFGKAMVYASAGYSFGSFQDGSPIYTQSGWVAGVGVDVMVTDHLFVGLEYSMRDIISSNTPATVIEIHSEIQSVALRVGWNF